MDFLFVVWGEEVAPLRTAARRRRTSGLMELGSPMIARQVRLENETVARLNQVLESTA